jgi:hypothetical protein
METGGTGWRNLGEEPVVETPWFRLRQAEVELPGGRRIDHYLLRLPPYLQTVMLDDRDRVLLLWRHRFIPDSWGWEIPSGIADPGEDLPAAAAREALKESSWEPVAPELLMRLEPAGKCAPPSPRRRCCFWWLEVGGELGSRIDRTGKSIFQLGGGSAPMRRARAEPIG